MVKKSGRKKKGSDAERELLKDFYERGWGGTRTAGSGSSNLESPDVLVGGNVKDGRIYYGIECKAKGERKHYFDKEEIEELNEFCRRFGAVPLVGLRVDRDGWYFMYTGSLRATKKSYVFDLDKQDALIFEDLINV